MPTFMTQTEYYNFQSEYITSRLLELIPAHLTCEDDVSEYEEQACTDFDTKEQDMDIIIIPYPMVTDDAPPPYTP